MTGANHSERAVFLFVTRGICKVASLAFLFALALPGQEPVPSGIKFEVVSVRVMGAKEAAKRSPHVIGNDIVVRFRLSCTGQSFRYYTWGESISPLGYSVRLTETGVVWLYYARGDVEPRKSPGLDGWEKLIPGTWRLMTAHEQGAVEWEQFDTTKSEGERHAATVFIKVAGSELVKEIISDSYIVPTARASREQ